jgi:hypothetical protein
MLGYNPFGEQTQTISRLSGSIFVGGEGDYVFALSVDDIGALAIDGKPVVFARIGPGDARINGTIHLTRGAHDFLFYHINYAGPMRFTVAWKPPSAKAFGVVDRAAFGAAFGAVEGPLEQQNKPLIADFSADHVSECWVHDNYSHRYRFTGRSAAGVNPPQYEWDFGDGQKATGAIVEHVYIVAGVYPVRLTARIGANHDAQTTRLLVDRDYDAFRGNPLSPPTDSAAVLAKIVATYTVATIPPASLAPAAFLLNEGGEHSAAQAVAMRIAADKHHPHPSVAWDAVDNIPASAADRRQRLSTIPHDSDLQPHADRALADLLLWTEADFPAAVQLLQPRDKNGKSRDPVRYGQALILSGDADKGRGVLAGIAVKEDPIRQAALSGAQARTIEAYLEQKETEAGDGAWDDWMTRFPADFEGGYALWLKVRLIETRHNPATAAKVAEAFVKAIPTSAYAPRLLDHAAKLLEKSNPAKSAALRKMLKDGYPEDPLSQ